MVGQFNVSIGCENQRSQVKTAHFDARSILPAVDIFSVAFVPEASKSHGYYITRVIRAEVTIRHDGGFITTT
jgi:hypothetical protein